MSVVTPAIPRKIWQTWKTKTLPAKMAKNVAKMLADNPEYEYSLSDDADCIQLLMENFGPNFVNAFWAPRFGMFRADLWRYAVLWLHGGVYLDLDAVLLEPLSAVIRDPFTLIIPKDIGASGLYQAFVACAPKHPAIWHMLQLAFYNIASRRPLISDLALSGPLVAEVAVNLYLEKVKTTAHFKPGVYDAGKLLIIEHQSHVGFDESYVVDDSGRRFFRTKYPGYRNLFTWHSLKKLLHIESYYCDERDEPTRRLYSMILAQKAAILFLFVCLIIMLILAWQ